MVFEVNRIHVLINMIKYSVNIRGTVTLIEMKGDSHLKFHEKIMGIIEDRDDMTSSSVAIKIGVSKQYMSKF